MKKCIVVLDADHSHCGRLCKLLDENQYSIKPIHSIQHLESNIQQCNCLAVILDIDSIPVDNRRIRDLALKYPGTRFLCTSKDRFHPELKDAICYHIYACLNKPIDPDELLFWIKSIYEEENVPDT